METKLLKCVIPKNGSMPYYLVEFKHNNETKIIRTDINAFKYEYDKLLLWTEKEWNTGKFESCIEREE